VILAQFWQNLSHWVSCCFIFHRATIFGSFKELVTVSKEFARNCKFIDTGHVFLKQKGLPPKKSDVFQGQIGYYICIKTVIIQVGSQKSIIKYKIKLK